MKKLVIQRRELCLLDARRRVSCTDLERHIHFHRASRKDPFDDDGVSAAAPTLALLSCT